MKKLGGAAVPVRFVISRFWIMVGRKEGGGICRGISASVVN